MILCACKSRCGLSRFRLLYCRSNSSRCGVPASSFILRRIRERVGGSSGRRLAEAQEVASALARLRTKYVKLTVNVHGADVWCASFNQRNADVSSELKETDSNSNALQRFPSGRYSNAFQLPPSRPRPSSCRPGDSCQILLQPAQRMRPRSRPITQCAGSVSSCVQADRQNSIRR